MIIVWIKVKMALTMEQKNDLDFILKNLLAGGKYSYIILNIISKLIYW